MGTRTTLSFGAYCEFEANNCLPVTWLSLFDSRDLLVETRREEYRRMEKPTTKDWKEGVLRRFLSQVGGFFGRGTTQQTAELSRSAAASQDSCEFEEYEVAIYRTAQATALQRVELAIDRLKGSSPAWAFLRPLEILRDELRHCPPGGVIELDVTQFWAMNETFKQRVTQAVAAFEKMLNELRGDEQDLVILDQLVNDYSLGQISSVAGLDPEDRMFVLIGTYWGDEEHEGMYTPEHFGEAYWTAG